MVNNYVSNPYNQETVTYYGQQARIVDSSKSDIVTIEFEDGTKKQVSRSSLLTTHLFYWNQEKIESNNKRIEEYRTLAAEAEQEKKSLWNQIKAIKDQINSKFHEWGTRFLHNMSDAQRDEYITMIDQTRSLQSDATAAGNKSFGYTLSAFMLACDNRKYC